MNTLVETLVNDNLALAYSMAAMFGAGDEVVSDAMYGLYKAATRYDASLGYTFATFAHSVIKRTILNGIRSRKNNYACLTDINSEGNTIEAVDYRTENTSNTGRLLDVAAGVLDADELAAVRARYFDGESYADTAKRLGITRQTAHARTANAVSKLRKSGKFNNL